MGIWCTAHRQLCVLSLPNFHATQPALPATSFNSYWLTRYASGSSVANRRWLHPHRTAQWKKIQATTDSAALQIALLPGGCDAEVSAFGAGAMRLTTTGTTRHDAGRCWLVFTSVSPLPWWHWFVVMPKPQM